jgi:FlaA1/EpsC-like NDP-sugar epimerase
MRSFVDKILHPTSLKRVLFFTFWDVVIIVTSLYLSFFLRFEFAIPDEYAIRLFYSIPLFLIVKLIAFGLFRMYSVVWRFVGIRDLWNIMSALLVSEAVLMALILVPLPSYRPFVTVFAISGFPRSIFFVDGMLSFLMLSGLLLSKRIYLEVLRRNNQVKPGRKTIILGAGNTGEMVLRDIIKQGFSEFYPVAFLDDDSVKSGTYLHGVKVYGAIQDLPSAVSKFHAEAVIIAIPRLDHKALRRIYAAVKASNIQTIKIVPRIYDFHKPNINLKNLEEIRIEDLIGRDVVTIEYEEIERFIADRVVLVTGAGGSIGSEIAMQVCAFNPRHVILFDADETELHNLELRMKRTYPHFLFHDRGAFLFTKFHTADGTCLVSCVVGDVRDRDLVEASFASLRPEVVFHAAAYKHVPIMESNGNEAVKVNMFGTYNLARAAVQYGVDRFIMISTDKAVRPTSVMGATKRMAEYICKAHNDPQCTRFIAVRFGNVLGSRGSVLPLFLEQLRHGGPLTVTHKDMLRYFMTIPEAVSLVLQASVIGSGGYVMVLDMGKPVRIVHLAEELIRLHGLEPYKDVDLAFVGMRPGEKLFEEVLTAEEGTTASRHEKIFVAKDATRYSKEQIETILEEFKTVVRDSPRDGNDNLRALLRKYVKHFQAPQEQNAPLDNDLTARPDVGQEPK